MWTKTIRIAFSFARQIWQRLNGAPPPPMSFRDPQNASCSRHWMKQPFENNVAASPLKTQTFVLLTRLNSQSANGTFVSVCSNWPRLRISQCRVGRVRIRPREVARLAHAHTRTVVVVDRVSVHLVLTRPARHLLEGVGRRHLDGARRLLAVQPVKQRLLHRRLRLRTR